MDPRYDIPRRAAAGGVSGGSGGSTNSSPALGAQSRRRKMPPRPADFKLQIIIIGSRGVGKTSLMERFTDDTFCESCKSTVGENRGLFFSLLFYLGSFSWLKKRDPTTS
ncbi:Ras- protein Rab-12 [Goodea atripinnis]|uniref:Ras- protein Rab-12 n=1 Tax=Goodea atripinnis TaxID=208336 RepID=A0ABV0PCZ0_9TELE